MSIAEARGEYGLLANFGWSFWFGICSCLLLILLVCLGFLIISLNVTIVLGFQICITYLGISAKLLCLLSRHSTIGNHCLPSLSWLSCPLINLVPLDFPIPLLLHPVHKNNYIRDKCGQAHKYTSDNLSTLKRPILIVKPAE